MLRVTNLVRLNVIAQFANWYQDATPQAAREIAQKIVESARDSMQEGYGVPSAPGTPPNIQTGNLYNSIERVDTPDGADVIVGADYAAELEFGSARVAARPFMTPAVERVGGEADKVAVSYFNKNTPGTSL